jgi:hypothetical protein
LVERVLCKHEVIGSIPFTSTSIDWENFEIDQARAMFFGMSVGRILLFDIVDKYL